MKKKLLLNPPKKGGLAALIVTALFLLPFGKAGMGYAQIDSSLIKRVAVDTVKQQLNMDAIYSRPFLKAGKLPVSIGGYFEANWQNINNNINTGLGNQFQFRRFSLFVASSISKRIKFLSEIEFENDPTDDPDELGKGPKIEIEYAALDIELHPLVNLRGGVILNPIGSFNQNHDGPKWEFVDRPLAMTQMLPATLSSTGAGLYGKHYTKNWLFGYEVYLTGGLNDSIIDNPQGRTFLPAANSDPGHLSNNVSGMPMTTAKLSVRNNHIGELGLSYMGGVYNTWQKEGGILDSKRRCDVFDIDFNTKLPILKTAIRGEWAWIFVNVPPTYSPQYSNKQHGGYVDIVQPVIQRRMLGWDKAVINLAMRVEYVDWNVGYFQSTGTKMYNDVWSIVPAISFRPTPQTVIRFNYRYERQRDIIGNPFLNTGGFSLGLATYF